MDQKEGAMQQMQQEIEEETTMMDTTGIDFLCSQHKHGF